MKRVNQLSEDAIHEEGFRFGHFCRTLEERIESYAANESYPDSLATVAERLAVFFRTKAQDLRASHRAAELLQQMRENGKTTRVHRAGKKQQTVHVAPRGSRTLKRRISASGRRIAEAQRRRWRGIKSRPRKKMHWTQRPENKEKMMAHLDMMRRKKAS